MSASSTRCLIAISKPLVSLQFASPKKQKQNTTTSIQEIFSKDYTGKNNGKDFEVHFVTLHVATFPFLLSLLAATSLLFTRTRTWWQQSECPFKKDSSTENDELTFQWIKAKGHNWLRKNMARFPGSAGKNRQFCLECSDHSMKSAQMQQINMADKKWVKVSHFSTSKGYKLQVTVLQCSSFPTQSFLYTDHFWLKLWAIPCKSLEFSR